MAGMVPKYTAQLVILETAANGKLVQDLETIMKGTGDAVSRADVLRQALAPGLRKLAKQYEVELTSLEASRQELDPAPQG
jgi:division protein CdvB (Snf7/Vps24/ESCRT-III family)